MKRLTPVEIIDRATRYNGDTDAIIEALDAAGYRIISSNATAIIECDRPITEQQAARIKFEWERSWWPAPKPGTHEADLYRHSVIDHFHDGAASALSGWTEEQNLEFSTARRWSLLAQEATSP